MWNFCDWLVIVSPTKSYNYNNVLTVFYCQFNLKSKIISMKLNNLPFVSKILPHPGFGVGRSASQFSWQRQACFPMMLLLEQSDSGWMTHTDIQDNKQILSLLWVNWVIYLYHVLLFPDFFSFNRSNLRSDVPLILVQSLFSLSPSRFWAFMPVYEGFWPFDTS